MEKIKEELIFKIKQYIDIIKKEYPDLVNVDDNNLEDKVHIEDTGTISLFVKRGEFYFPLDAFKVLKVMEKIPGFGSVKNHKPYGVGSMVINNNTYLTFIKHVFLKGLSPLEYYKEILLHEVMHFCGSGGGTAIREGINELKTRQLAQKYNLNTSYCGYPKEVKIAYELELLFGREVIDKIAFAKGYGEIYEILSSVSNDATEFYFELERTMEMEFNSKYMSHKYPGVMGPFKKTKNYETIDYSRAYELLDEYKKSIGSDTLCQR